MPRSVCRARNGKAWQAWRGTARHGEARQGKTGKTEPIIQLYKALEMGITNKQRAMFRRGSETYASSHGVNAEDAFNELNRIKLRDAALTARAVVEESRPDDAVLHPIFEWDDTRAAESYREHQATSLIRSVRLIAEPDDSITERTTTTHEPAFINVSPSGSVGAYKSPTEVVRTESYFATAIENASRQVAAAQDAMNELRRLAEERGDERATLIFAAISSLEVAREAIQRFH
jgi:hypothetical protein